MLTAPRTGPESRYRESLIKFGGAGTDDIRNLNDYQREALFEYLEQHRLEDVTLCVAYWLMRSERDFNMNQSDIANEAGVTRSFISALLSGRTLSKPETFERLARVTGANPVEFLVAAGLLDISDVLAYQLPSREDWMPIAKKLVNVPSNKRRKYVALVGAVLDTVLAVTTPEDSKS